MDNIDEDITQVKDILSKPLPHDNLENLRYEISVNVAWLGRVAYLKRLWEQKYREEKNRYLLPKDKAYTDLDRETQVNANVAETHRKYGTLQDFESHLSTRISTAQTLLNSHMVEMKRMA
jgi:hypothetical protein